MKKVTKNDDDEMRDHYDFSQGVRGKHFKAYRQGHEVHIHGANGSTSVRYFGQEEGAIMVDPDLKPYFPDSQSVNNALRTEVRRTTQQGSEQDCGSHLIAKMPWGDRPITGIQNPSECGLY
jgi:hypothetical protein